MSENPDSLWQKRDGGDYGLTPEAMATLEGCLQKADCNGVQKIVSRLHPADAADLLKKLNKEQRQRLLTSLQTDTLSDIIAYIDTEIRDDLLEGVPSSLLVAAVAHLDTDDAIKVISDLDDHEQLEILEALPEPDRVILEEGLTFPEDSAGRLMQRELVAVPTHWTVGHTIDHLRSGHALPDVFYDIIVVDAAHKPVGMIALSTLLKSQRPTEVLAIMQTDFRRFNVTTPSEDVAYTFRRYGLVSAPVVEAGGRLLGMITVDDVVDLIEEETEEDLMHLGGIYSLDFYRASASTTLQRFPWLLVNMLTAILAAFVISLFESTIEHLVALAILMPIVASMGGNAGTQALTVVIRAMALRLITKENTRVVITKEALVGLSNGVLFAIVSGFGCALIFEDTLLGVVIALAMVINLFVAGVSATVIPLALKRLRVDPAVASAVFLTTVTDVVGFFSFLGLATLLLL